MNEYESKKQDRIDRYRELADKAARESNQMHDQAQRMASVIPLGQPILVGHHSESRDRNYRARFQGKYEKSFELQKKADYYEQKASAAESNHAISSDDPDAPDRLRERIAELEARQSQMKAVNQAHTRFLKNPASLDTVDLPESIKETIREYVPQYSWEPHPIAPYQFQNLGGNIRRLKERLTSLKATRAATEHAERSVQRFDTLGLAEGFRVIENPDINRIQITFAGKPKDETRSLLKHQGFRWSPTEMTWQRQLNNSGRWAAEYVAKLLLCYCATLGNKCDFCTEIRTPAQVAE